MNVKQILTVLLATALLWIPFSSSAHKLNLFVWTDSNTVTVESSLSGGRTLVHGTVTVINTANGNIIVSGKTDNSGIFSFSLDQEIVKQSPTLDIIVSGGDGHQAHWLLQGDEYGGRTETGMIVQGQPEKQPAAQQMTDGECLYLSKTELEQLLDSHLEQKLAPIRKNIGMLVNPTPSLRDVGAGIGYLLGCTGIIAWLRSRKQNNMNTRKGEQ